MDALDQFAYFPTGNPIYFLPVIDSLATDPVLPDYPIHLINKGLYNQVPYISGLMENEGGYFYQRLNETGYVFDRDYINNDLDQLVQNYTLLTGDELTQITALVYEYYFSDIDLDNLTVVGDAVQDFLSDAMFNAGNFKTLSLLHKGDGYPVMYSYVFAYHGEYMGFPSSGMTAHGDEIPYIFDVEMDNNGILDAQDNVTSERLLTLWTTFAKTGNPNPASSDVISVTWEEITSYDSIPFLNIGSELSMQEDFRWNRMSYWNDTILPIIYAN